MTVGNRLVRLGALLLALLLVPAAFAQPVAWPEGRKAAIVLTYDDAMQSHLDNAVPQLDAAGLKGTFFLNVRFDEAGVERWRAVAAKGHELANHTQFHPCPRGSFEMERQYESENYSEKGMLAEIAAMNVLLHAIDGKTGRTMATPCGKSLAGGKSYTEALRAAGTIRYLRDAIGEGAVIADPRKVDPMNVPSRAFPETVTAEELIASVKEVQASGGMGVLLFHGIGGDWLQTSNEAHKGLLAYLKAHEREIWVAPFQTAMDHATGAKR